MPRGWGSIGTADLIRIYFQTKGIAYPYQVYRFIDRYLASRHGKYRPPTYDTIRSMFYALRRLQLIIPIATPPRKPEQGKDILPRQIQLHRDPRSFYQLNQSRANSIMWRNPKLAWQAAREEGTALFAPGPTLPKEESRARRARERFVEGSREREELAAARRRISSPLERWNEIKDLPRLAVDEEEVRRFIIENKL
jgi:hypothetical protein